MTEISKNVAYMRLILSENEPISFYIGLYVAYNGRICSRVGRYAPGLAVGPDDPPFIVFQCPSLGSDDPPLTFSVVYSSPSVAPKTG